MKFLAILKDSLREAIDAKVFYVMIGLSLLLVAVGMTATFPVKPGGELVMKMASVPLSVDMSNFDPMEMQQGAEGGGDPMRMVRRVRGAYQVEKVYALNNAEDLPTSPFRH